VSGADVLDVTMIQTRGFRNFPGGFRLRLRLPYYRGLWTSLIDGATVTVDGQRFDADEIRWRITGDECSLAELTASETLRWPVDVPAVLAIPREEPLAVGFHEVSAELRLRMSYIPVELQPTIWAEQRRLVITK